MTKAEKLAAFAEEKDITIYELDLKGNEDAFCAPTEEGDIIALNRRKVLSDADRTVKYAHEIGHCETGAFYNQYSSLFLRSQAEYRADKWAAYKLMPYDKIMEAARNGCRKVWELAEHFGVTEDFVRKALYIYSRTA